MWPRVGDLCLTSFRNFLSRCVVSSRVCMCCTYWLAKNATLAVGHCHLNTLSEIQKARPVSSGVVLSAWLRTYDTVCRSVCSQLLCVWWINRQSQVSLVSVTSGPSFRNSCFSEKLRSAVSFAGTYRLQLARLLQTRVRLQSYCTAQRTELSRSTGTGPQAVVMGC
jgi:hypothetical protein